MKKIKTIILILAILSLTACVKEPDIIDTVNPNIAKPITNVGSDIIVDIPVVDPIIPKLPKIDKPTLAKTEKEIIEDFEKIDRHDINDEESVDEYNDIVSKGIKECGGIVINVEPGGNPIQKITELLNSDKCSK